MELLNTMELIEGMVVGKNIICPQTQSIILGEGVKLSENFIKSLKNRGIDEIFVKSLYTLDFNPYDNINSNLKRNYLREIRKFAPDLKSAALNDEIVEASKMAAQLVPYIYGNDKVSEICLEMRIVNREFYEHAISVSTLSLILALLKGVDKNRALEIAIAGLFHDLGMLEAKAIIYHQKDNKRDEQLWKECPTYGYHLAMEKKLTSKIANLIQHTRELWNGEGYPSKLKGEEIPLGSRIIAIAQCYDEFIRFNKVYPYEAMEYLYGASGYYFDAELVELFANNVSIYPLKAMVRLTTGEVGTVINVRQNKGPRPIVRIYYNAFNKPFLNPKEIDLGRERTIFIKEILSF